MREEQDSHIVLFTRSVSTDNNSNQNSQ